jgi:hypothetical protein
MCLICYGKRIGYENLEGLTEIDCSFCPKVEFIPRVEGLRTLKCDACANLRKIEVGDDLVQLSCTYCPNLRELPQKAISLENLLCGACPIEVIPFYPKVRKISAGRCGKLFKLCGESQLRTMTSFAGESQSEALLMTSSAGESQLRTMTSSAGESQVLENLVYLDCEGCSQLCELPETPQLRTLLCVNCGISEISKIPSLETLNTSCSRISELANLKSLRFIDALDLEVFPNFPLLEDIMLFNCPKITEIPKWKYDWTGKRTRLFPILKNILCRNCSNLREIQNFDSLEILICSGCSMFILLDIEFYSKLNLDKNLIGIIDFNQKTLSSRLRRKREFTLEIEPELARRTWEPTRAIRWCWDEKQKSKFLESFKSVEDREEAKRMMGISV